MKGGFIAAAIGAGATCAGIGLLFSSSSKASTRAQELIDEMCKTSAGTPVKDVILHAQALGFTNEDEQSAAWPEIALEKAGAALPTAVEDASLPGISSGTLILSKVTRYPFDTADCRIELEDRLVVSARR